MPDPTAALEHRLRLAHQSRRAKEHQLDDIRRALCDAGFMQDDDPYGHADLADVIRQVGVAEAAKPAARPIRDCGKGHVHDAHDWDDPGGVYGCIGFPVRKATPLPCSINHDCPGQVRPESPTAQGEPVVILYVNHRGQRGYRRILPRRLWFGTTDWHPERQWFLDATDLDRDVLRSFAVRDILAFDLQPGPLA